MLPTVVLMLTHVVVVHFGSMVRTGTGCSDHQVPVRTWPVETTVLLYYKFETSQVKIRL